MKPFKADAYTANALVEAGVDASICYKLLVDGPNAQPERARLSIFGRKRTELTGVYAWGSDVNFLLNLGGDNESETV